MDFDEEQILPPIEREERWKAALARARLSDGTKAKYRATNNIFMDWARSQQIYAFSKDSFLRFQAHYKNPDNKPGYARPDNTMKNMVKALRYRFVQCEEYPADAIPTYRGASLVRPHVAYSDVQLAVIRATCGEDTENRLIVELLYEMAARVQDVALLHWSAVKPEQGPELPGCALVHLKALKSSERNMLLSAATYERLKAYKDKQGIAKNEWPARQIFDVPNANALVKRLARYFKGKLDFDFQSHNFRTTMATDLYKETNDIVTVGRFVGHASVKTTQGYIKLDERKIRGIVGRVVQLSK